MALNNDFKIKNRLNSTGGALFGNYAAGPYSINTTGHILSANVNLLNIFALAGSTGSAVSVVNSNSANWSSVYTTTFANSANWNSNYTNTFANSANWSSVYTVTFANSANWNSNYSTTFANSARWSSVYSSYNGASGSLITSIANAGTQGNLTITSLGGSTGLGLTNLTTGGSPQFTNLTITNNLSVLGDFTYLNTSVSVTSALSVVNAGTGPALFVKQTGVQPIAYFVDADGTGDIIFENNGFVGLGTSNPNNRLTVVGNISSTGTIYVSGAILTGIAPTTVTTGNRIVTVETNGKLTYDQLAANESIITGIGLASDKLVKSTNNPNILSAGSITDTVSGVAIDRNVPFIIGVDDGAGNDWYVVKQTFFKPIAPTGSTIATLLTSMPSPNILLNTPSRLMQVKYTVLLFTDLTLHGSSNNRTAFEVLAPIGDTTTAGTVYAIVDTNTPLLNDIDMNIASSAGRTSAVLSISSTTGCLGLIEASGYYGPITYNP
jgi:hypothetical protein